MLSFMKDVLAVIMGGGAGTRLYPLTKLRAKPAVPLAGYYRLIDIPISNCINSGVNRIYVLTQYNSVSLHRHVVRTYQFDNFSGGWVRILAAEQTPVSESWYQGTADALRKQLYQLQVPSPRDILILAGDHLYRMDYSEFVRFHGLHEADITIAVKPVKADAASSLGILQADKEGRIHKFKEKPSLDQLEGLASLEGDNPYMASMGIYVFRTKTLVDILRTEPGDDFGRNIIPAAIDKGLRVFAYPFEGYWEDIGTIRAFYEVNLALTGPNPPFDFFAAEWPIYTRARFLPCSQVIDSSLMRVWIAPGCRLDHAAVSDSVIGLRSIVSSGTHLHRVVMMGADDFESLAQKDENQRLGLPDIGVGHGSVIEDAILDKNARIGCNVVIRSHLDAPNEETDNYVVREGIVVVPKGAVIPDNTVI
ncbi:MAG TPA: glucose-1-phosphate adenylyltransferase [Anaerolineae bacterium]|nr:glucose-1-phosphate adenylyltransferase [Anaerolineae bacterium]HQH37138.1 glucose-1-phosphate adenylyltransferase [Anaerolineae bacterium]